VWLYFRFPLSLRMIEEMLAARGMVVSHETVRQWALKFGQDFANEIRRMLFLGIDVSKDKLDGAAMSEDTGAVLGRRSVPNTPAGIERLRCWAETIASSSEPAAIHAVIEATAAYHELAAHRLAAAGVSVSVVNPARVRSFAQGIAVLGKTDRLDAAVLARFGRLTRPKVWRPSAPAIRDLQALLARLEAVEADLRRGGQSARASSCAWLP
jgi:transposase